MTEVERNALLSFARSLGIPIEFARRAGGVSVLIGVDNNARRCAYSDYQDAIAFLTNTLLARAAGVPGAQSSGTAGRSV